MTRVMIKSRRKKKRTKKRTRETSALSHTCPPSSSGLRCRSDHSLNATTESPAVAASQFVAAATVITFPSLCVKDCRWNANGFSLIASCVRTDATDGANVSTDVAQAPSSAVRSRSSPSTTCVSSACSLTCAAASAILVLRGGEHIQAPQPRQHHVTSIATTAKITTRSIIRRMAHHGNSEDDDEPELFVEGDCVVVV